MRFVVCLIGGSNGTHVLAADLGRDPKFEVRIVTRRPQDWSRSITCEEHTPFPGNSIPLFKGSSATYTGTVDMVVGYDDVAGAMHGADMVFMTCPVSAHRDLLELVVPHIPDHPILLGTSYAQGGFDWVCRDVFKRYPRQAARTTVFGLKAFPYLCKTTEYGKAVTLFGRFPQLSLAVSPDLPRHRTDALRILEPMLKMRLPACSFISCIIDTTNQVLHPGIQAQLFKGYTPHNGKTYDRHKGFYSELDAEGGRYLYDLFYVEMPLLASKLREAFALYPSRLLANTKLTSDIIGSAVIGSLTSVLPGAVTEMLTPRVFAPSVTYCIANNQRLVAVKAPMTAVTDGAGGPDVYTPNTTSRMFVDDIPHGLCVMLGIAEIVGLEMPVTVKLIHDNQRMMGKQYIASTPDADGHYCHGKEWHETNAPQSYGVHTLQELVEFLAWDRSKDITLAEGAANARLSKL